MARQCASLSRAEPAADPHETGVPEAIQQPITFNYNEAEFTSEGRRAAASLSNYLRSERLEVVTLSGYADERGSEPYNIELSRQRLDTVATYLRNAGYAGGLVLLPKGKMEPFAIPSRQSLARDDAYQLDAAFKSITRNSRGALCGIYNLLVAVVQWTPWWAYRPKLARRIAMVTAALRLPTVSQSSFFLW